MPAEVEFMIDEINYFPKRENYQKKKKAADDWKDLKKQKIFHDSKKPNAPGAKKEPGGSRKPRPPEKPK